jgi:hypothetical protein
VGLLVNLPTNIRVARWYIWETRNPNLGKFWRAHIASPLCSGRIWKVGDKKTFWRALKWKILVYFMIIWTFLRPFFIFFVHWVFLSHFGILSQEKIWQPWYYQHSQCFREQFFQTWAKVSGEKKLFS